MSNSMNGSWDDVYSINLDSFTDTITITSPTVGAVGAAGTYLTAGINGSYTWGDASITTTTNLTPNSLDVKGDANFDGDITLQGKSLKDTLDNIEKRLAILHPNPELEEKWERLKSLGQMYRELEAEILEKEEVWSILKK
jgi:hypothetical protein